MDGTVVYKNQNDTLSLTRQKKSKMDALKMELLQYSLWHKKQRISDPPSVVFSEESSLKKCNNEIVLYKEGMAPLDAS